ncbi:1-phosphatidylinositol 4,5-bisphosphate phosphodiesterase eta-2a [Aplochiton taeniatus]
MTASIRATMITDSPNPSLSSSTSPSLRSSITMATDDQSFVSTASLPCCHFLSDNVITVVEKCMSSMQTGTQMVKLRGGPKGLVRFFYLDQHKSCIRWRPSRKNEKAKISIDSIREVCEGKQSEIFQRYSDGSFDPNCCFSLYYGEHMESLDLVSGCGEEARTWITGLRYLMAGISDEDSLARRQRTRDQWLKQTFAEADKNGDGSLSISEVLQLLHKLNVNLPRQKVKQMFKEADTDDNQGTLGFEEFCSFYKMMSTRRDLYLLLLTYSNQKDHLDAADLSRFLEHEQKMTTATKEHCLEIVNKFEPCADNKKNGVLGIDGFTNYMRSPAGDIFNHDHYEVTQDMSQPLCHYFVSSSHNTYLMGDQLMSQSRVDMYAWVLQAGCRCVEVDCWDGQDGEPIVHHGYTLTSKILFRDVIETINKYAFVKNDYPVILSIENHCSVLQQKKMAQCMVEVLGDKLDLSNVQADETDLLPSPESLRGKILVKGKKLPSTIDEDAEEGDVSDEDSADEMDDDCKLMNGDTSMNRKQVENVAKKKLDNLMKESKIRDREDPDSFTIAALSPSGTPADQAGPTVKGEEGPDTADEANPSTNKRVGRSFMGSFSKRKKKTPKLKKTSSFEDTDTDQESSSSASRAPLHNRKKKTMKLSRALSDLVKYTKSVGIQDIETQATASSSWQVSSLSETKAHQILQQRAAVFLHYNQRQLSRVYPSSYRVDSSNFNPQPFWNAGCQLVALNYQSEGRVLQLNRAKFNSNGNCGYILKPACMWEGSFNPFLEDPLPGQMRKQLVLKIISGQQLPKPKDSMMGDRGEIIDPFVEVEVIGLPVDCCKEQTRMVDDNGFNPMWEETLVFTLHMPELALIRFLVWDHDPIGQDFIGQRTIAFSSMITGYRHVYLEGMEEASIFVHIAVNDITGKARPASGIKGLFHRNPKQSSLDSHAAAQLNRKHPFGAHLLRRTASAPTKGQPKVKKGLPEIARETKDTSSEGPSEDQDAASTSSQRGATARPGPWEHPNGACHSEAGKGQSTVLRPMPALQLLDSISDKYGDQSVSRSTPTLAVSTSLLAVSTSPLTVSTSPLTVSTSPHAVNQLPLAVNQSPLALNQSPLALNQLPPTPAESLSKVNRDSKPPTLASNGPLTLCMPCPQEPPQRPSDLKKNSAQANLEEGVGPIPLAPPPAELQTVQTLRTLFDPAPPHTPVRRAGSKGLVCSDAAGGRSQWVTPQVCTDATLGDRLWSRAEPSSHRDSVSSSSSISSNDTVIDLSLPNLARRSLGCLGPASEPLWVSPTHSTAHPFHSPLGSKSKSNPNLRQGELEEEEEEEEPRALGSPRENQATSSPSTLTQRRHTWSRLYMDGLKQQQQQQQQQQKKKKQQPSSSSPAPPPTNPLVPSTSMSKSLGDLTSDDIACNFESKYRSISRSFLLPPSRDPKRRGSLPSSLAAGGLTEQLRRLTDVEPLTPGDFTSQSRQRPPEEEEEQQQEVPLRRMSSRSQSRVRYIANRAKQAQERLRLQGLAQERLRLQGLAQERQRLQGLAHGPLQGRSPSMGFSITGSPSPLEERGIPEGACCVAQSPCSSLDLLNQLTGPGPPRRLSQAPQDPDNYSDEVFFMLRL